MEDSNNGFNQQWEGYYTEEQIQQYQMYYGTYHGYYNYGQYSSSQYNQFLVQGNNQINLSNTGFLNNNSEKKKIWEKKNNKKGKRLEKEQNEFNLIQTNKREDKLSKSIKNSSKNNNQHEQSEQDQKCQQEQTIDQKKNQENQSVESDSELEEQAEHFDGGVDEQGLKYLKEKGYHDQQTNRILMAHLYNNVLEVQKCLQWCESQQAIKQVLGEFQKNFMISKYLGFVGNDLFHWQVLSVIQKNQNNLQSSLKRLAKRVKIKQHKKQIDQITKDYTFNVVNEIPRDSIFMIDGFNALRANKHLKKLMKDPDHKSKLQSVLRLKNLVQTIQHGYLVLDKKFLTQEIQQQIQKSLVKVNGQKKVQIVYADEGLKADDKIVQILKQMPTQKRKDVLLVTSDRLLIKDCQKLCGDNLPSMGGKMFIKQCKLMLPKGVLKNKIIKGHLKQTIELDI